jgi:branched-subunit amino acid ABC-type transport system permease component
MEGLIDYVILGTTVACSFGTAFLVQKITLGLILKAMEQKRKGV